MARPRQRKEDAVGTLNRIREVRKARGESSRSLAEKVSAAGYDLHYSTLVKVENGERSLHGELLETIAKVLEVEPYDLLVSKNRPTSQNVPVVEITDLAALMMTGADIADSADSYVPVFDAGRLVAITGYDARWSPTLRGIVVVDLDDNRTAPEDFAQDDQQSLPNAVFLAVAGGAMLLIRRKGDGWIDAAGKSVNKPVVLGRVVQDIVRLRLDPPDADDLAEAYRKLEENA